MPFGRRFNPKRLAVLKAYILQYMWFQWVLEHIIKPFKIWLDGTGHKCILGTGVDGSSLSYVNV